MVLTLYRIFCFCFQMCNRLPEIKKSGDAGIFPVYYSLNINALVGETRNFRGGTKFPISNLRSLCRMVDVTCLITGCLQ